MRFLRDSGSIALRGSNTAQCLHIAAGRAGVGEGTVVGDGHGVVGEGTGDI